MDLTHCFRFLDDKLNRRLLALLKKKRVRHLVDEKGIVHYSPGDEEFVENELISPIRDQLFPSWQVLSCPEDWVERYKRYMTEHGVPFVEESINNQVWFLIPGKYRPHAWKLAS